MHARGLQVLLCDSGVPSDATGWIVAALLAAAWAATALVRRASRRRFTRLMRDESASGSSALSVSSSAARLALRWLTSKPRAMNAARAHSTEWTKSAGLSAATASARYWSLLSSSPFQRARPSAP